MQPPTAPVGRPSPATGPVRGDEPRLLDTARHAAGATLHVLGADPGEPAVQELLAWIAAAVYGYLARDGRPAADHTNRERRCTADPTTLRTYLTNPPPAHTGPAVADRLDLDATFRTGAARVPARLHDLLAWAQGDDVFGLDDHEIHVFQVAGHAGRGPRHYLLTVQPPQGPQLCYGTLTEPELLGSNTNGVDAGIQALTVLAGHVNALLADHDNHQRRPAPTEPRATAAPAGPAARPRAAYPFAAPLTSPPAAPAPLSTAATDPRPSGPHR